MAKEKRPDPKVESLRECGTLNPQAEDVRDPKFASGEFFDPRDLVQVKYEMLRRVSTDGAPISQASAEFGFSRPSFYQAQAAFQREGLAGLVPRKRGPHGPHKLTQRVLDLLKEARAKDGQVHPRELAQEVKGRFDVEIHPRTIERALARQKKKRQSRPMTRGRAPSLG